MSSSAGRCARAPSAKTAPSSRCRSSARVRSPERWRSWPAAGCTAPRFTQRRTACWSAFRAARSSMSSRLPRRSSRNCPRASGAALRALSSPWASLACSVRCRSQCCVTWSHACNGCRLQAGEVLFSEGDSGHDLYFILGGRLRAVAGGRVLSEMTRGESIGEIALLTGEPRTATVIAVRDSELVRISRETFEEIVQKYPKVMQVLAQIVVQRLRAKERTSCASQPEGCASQCWGSAPPGPMPISPRGWSRHWRASVQRCICPVNGSMRCSTSPGSPTPAGITSVACA